ncbi:hypothetical protein BLOT_006437 [Blomia tropicalis]|nr:hypothetical protein BLOT_006437 [Blomia tropicalis]
MIHCRRLSDISFRKRAHWEQWANLKCEVINTHGYIEFNVGVVTGGWIPGIPDNSKLTLDLDSGSSHPAGYVNDSFHIITNVGYCNNKTVLQQCR